MPWHPVASGMCDRNVNAADGVGSLKHEPRTHPAHAEGAWCITVPTGTAKMEIPGYNPRRLPTRPRRCSSLAGGPTQLDLRVGQVT
jgi:hypothetical protein